MWEDSEEPEETDTTQQALQTQQGANNLPYCWVPGTSQAALQPPGPHLPPIWEADLRSLNPLKQ